MKRLGGFSVAPVILGEQARVAFGDEAAAAFGAEVAIVLIGETAGWLGQSLYLREMCGREEGAPPPVDLALERRHGDFVRSEIAARHVDACHDLSDGGLLVALTEMCLGGDMGVTIHLPPGLAVPAHAFLYGEDQGRYLVATDDGGALLAAAQAAGVPALPLGYSGGPDLIVEGLLSIALSDLRAAHEAWLPDYMNSAA